MYLIFDTETTGFKGETPNRMTQLAFGLFDKKGELIYEYESLVKPDNWVIPKEDFFIENNMSTERCLEFGKPAFNVLRELQDNLKKCKVKIAHNISFDNRIILSELKRYDITHQLFQFKKGYCTMKNTRDIVQALDSRGRIKNPKLNELHQFLFGNNFEGAHDALQDIRATARCYFKITKQ